MNINVELAQKLIAEQFPKWAHFPISPVSHSGWDNRTFHLGQDMVIRLPSAEEYAPQILKECLWLPKLSRQVSFKIPKPMGLGYPSEIYPWHWSINTWIDGSSLNQEPNVDLKQLAKVLAQFLKEFEAADAHNGPEAGKHNFYRGASLTHYDHEMQDAIPKIENDKQREIAGKLWHEAVSSKWEHLPVWVHGDIATGNLLIKDGGLEAVIDFGQLAIGDPACDLVIAWNFFDTDSRAIFKKSMNLDECTWIRAMGWCLWKTLCWPVKGTPVERILNDLYQGYSHV